MIRLVGAPCRGQSALGVDGTVLPLARQAGDGHTKPAERAAEKHFPRVASHTQHHPGHPMTHPDRPTRRGRLRCRAVHNKPPFSCQKQQAPEISAVAAEGKCAALHKEGGQQNGGRVRIPYLNGCG